MREAVANGPGTGLPGGGWQAVGEDAKKFLDRFHAKEPVTWVEAKDAAFAKLSKRGVRDPRQNILRARAVKFGDHFIARLVRPTVSD